jgi:hypothetical protein
MRRRIIQMVVALSLVASGWLAGRAKTPAPEFTLAIDAPEGRTFVECVRGCTLQGGRDEGNPNAATMQRYWFECKNAPTGGCKATVNGWLKYDNSR